MEILPTKIHRIRQDADLKAAESAILQIAPAPISGKENRRLMEKFPMTAEGHAMLQNELMHRQQVERPRIIQQIADARTDDGDLAENAEYRHRNYRKQTRAALQNLKTSWRAPKSS